nr:hypothetical protein [Tanacetum cinerariifolium]
MDLTIKGVIDSGCSRHMQGPCPILQTTKKLIEDMLLLEETPKEGKSQEKVPLKLVDEDPRKENECNDQEKEDNVNNTNNVKNISLTINVVGTNEDNELPFDPNMHALEDVGRFDFSNEDEDDGEMTNMNNLDTAIQVSHTPTTRIHKDHPLD